MPTLGPAALAGALLAAATATAGEITPEMTPEMTPERAAALERLVRQDCGSCHGLTLGGGLGPAIGPDRLAGADPEAVAAIILDGVPGTPMPPWRPLISEGDARWIAEYLLQAE